jgi:hypothetical protein
MLRPMSATDLRVADPWRLLEARLEPDAKGSPGKS